MTKQERYEAIQNAIPRPPVRVELGGGYYYKCYWLKCDNTLRRWERYCSKCGQKILWDDDYTDIKT